MRKLSSDQTVTSSCLKNELRSYFLFIIAYRDVAPIVQYSRRSGCAAHVKPLVVLPNCFDPYQFMDNALIAVPDIDPPDSWPAGNYFPSSTKGMFVNYNGGNGGDYHLV